MWLVKNGVPYDIAMEMSEAEILAHCVALGQFEGQEFDWNMMQWRKRSE